MWPFKKRAQGMPDEVARAERLHELVMKRNLVTEQRNKFEARLLRVLGPSRRFSYLGVPMVLLKVHSPHREDCYSPGFLAEYSTQHGIMRGYFNIETFPALAYENNWPEDWWRVDHV
jgi:hypothetical protein